MSRRDPAAEQDPAARRDRAHQRAHEAAGEAEGRRPAVLPDKSQAETAKRQADKGQAEIRGGLLRRHRDFRLLWCGETAGKFGASVTGVAMPLVAVSVLGASSFQVSLLAAASWLPWLVIGLPVGVWVDRSRRRPVMLASATASLTLFVCLPVLAWWGGLSIALLLTVALLAGVSAVVFQTAYTAYLPSLLAPADQPEGNAKLHGSASAAQIAGLGSGGFLTQFAGAVGGLAANALTFAVSLVCLLRIRHREPVPTRATTEIATTDTAGADTGAGPRPDKGAGGRQAAPARGRRSLTTEVGEGLRLVGGDPWLRTLALFGATSNLALMGYQSVHVVFLTREVGLAPGVVGGLIATASAGGVAGALLARRVAARVGTARATLLFELGFASCAPLIALTTDGLGVVLYLIGGCCVSAGVVAGNVIKASFQQRYCPPELLGRLTASAAFLNYGTLPLGALLGGALSTVFGLRAAMWITTAGVPLAGLVLFFSPIRHRRDLPTTRRTVAPKAARTARRS
ncbi:MFS transporter [Streptomyces zagrosensis]|uniref:MFS family permease n=1 Tax=Streptomyces zagrosensis TaxID=1042984 RepID=A0A7W9QBP2_9ACTN|nr:MFS transporter [Streptomyces zagrosensis]MBB5937285.1 MFS family permease [Streptomyces zagrosensis]